MVVLVKLPLFSSFQLANWSIGRWDSPDVGRGKKWKSKASRTGRGKRMEMVRKGMGIMEIGYPPSALEGMGMLWKRIEMLQKGIQECCERV